MENIVHEFRGRERSERAARLKGASEMSVLSAYCKAYPLERFRQFPEWHSAAVSESHLYVHEDYTVTEGIFRDDKVVLADVTPEWIEFCKSVLRFEVPDHKQNRS